jgi:hypothetical protein
MKAYLAGPMSGIPQFNFPAFYEAAAQLRALGWDIISPAEIDDTEDEGAALKSVDGSPESAKRSWGDFLARDVKLIADGGITAIVFLPGWTDSRGARLEATVGLLQKGFLFYNWLPSEKYTSAFSREAVADALHRKFLAEAV